MTTPPVTQRPNYGDATALARALDIQPTDEGVASVLEAVTDRLIRQIGYPLHYVELDQVWLSGDGGPMLSLPAIPVLDTPSVSIDGGPALTTGPGAGYQVGRRTGILWRPSGWPEGIENIHVTYSHGYREIPPAVTYAVTEAAILASTLRPGVDQITTGDESLRFVSRLADGGVTANWTAVVDTYRISDNGDGR